MQQIYKKIAELVENGEEFVLATVVNAESSTSGKMGFKMIVLPNGKTFGTVGGGMLEKDVIELAKEIFNTQKSIFKTYILREGEESSLGMVCGGKVQVYMEYVGRKPQLVIFGAGHIGKKMHDILSLDETFDLIVCDNRKEFANKENFPNAEVYNDDFKTSIEKMPLRNGAFVVLVTAGGKDDPVILKSLYEKNVKYAYIGMIGSTNRRDKCFTEAKKLGVPEKFLAEIFAPIGLAINSETPFEVAISIIGEIIAYRKGALKDVKTEKEVHK
ncbi:MAG: XdhC family protein [Caldisericaceae bacterium]|nr:XdhC family protein [Caldisericaceae bacterium]